MLPIALASITPVVLIASTVQIEQLQQITYLNSNAHPEITINLTVKQGFNRLLASTSAEKEKSVQEGSQSKTNQVSKKKSSQKSVAIQSDNYMKLIPTGKTNAVGNPLYKLYLYANGQEIGAYDTVSGRAHTQNNNRHTPGTEAPLPDGEYKVARTSIPGTIAEAGDRFLPIQPLFPTGRKALGIHYDPSFEKKNGEDGTSGCIALKNKQELDKVLNYVRTYQPKYLQVKIR